MTIRTANPFNVLPARGTNITHLNIRSLTPIKLDELRHLASEPQGKNLHILALTETWLKPRTSDNEINIPTYSTVRLDRDPIRKGGGIVIYLKDGISYRRKAELERKELETVWLEILLPHSKNYLINTTYRPPDAPADWLALYNQMVDDALSTSLDIISLGDFNINLLATSKSRTTLENITHGLGLKQLITQVTRPVSNTLIDHIYSSSPWHIREASTLNLRISDHLPIFANRKVGSPRNYESGQSFKYRSKKQFNSEAFLQDLSNQPWNLVEAQGTIDASLSVFHDIFTATLNRHAKSVTKKVKRLSRQPWLTAQIQQAMRDRDNETDPALIRVKRNQVTTLIREAKKSYYVSAFNAAAGSPTKIWKHAKDLLQTGKRRMGPDTVPPISPHVLNDWWTRSNKTQLTSVDDLRRISELTKARLGPRSLKLSFDPITVDQVWNRLTSLKADTATGPDGLPAFFLKIAAPVISPIITFIINRSIDLCYVPASWKVARVTPIFKSGPKDDPSNYRPISVLPILSKIFEAHLNSQLTSYFESNNLFSDAQHGFRSNHSCETALITVHDKWVNLLEAGLNVGVCFVDFSQAFDTVNHSLLLQKLSRYNISNCSVRLLESYLTARQQFVAIGKSVSNPKKVGAGVPQGSILGPCLFNIFINDLPLTLDPPPCIFADDTTVFAAEISMPVLRTRLSAQMTLASAWCDRNEMKINNKKTKTMLLNHSRKDTSEPLNLSIAGTNIEQTKRYTLLGLDIDDDLKWQSQISKVRNKLISRRFLLSRIKPYLPLPIRELFYTAMVRPIITYGLSLWGSSCQNQLNRILVQQKMMVRSILDQPARTPSSPLFSRLHFLPLQKLTIQHCTTLVFKVMTNPSPNSVSKLFTLARSARLRSQNLLNLVQCASNRGRSKFAVFAGKLWNSLPPACRIARSLPAFRLELATHLRT